MINMISLNFIPELIKWIYGSGSTVMSIAVTELESNVIRIYDSTSSANEPLKILDQVHG